MRLLDFGKLLMSATTSIPRPPPVDASLSARGSSYSGEFSRRLVCAACTLAPLGRRADAADDRRARAELGRLDRWELAAGRAGEVQAARAARPRTQRSSRLPRPSTRLLAQYSVPPPKTAKTRAPRSAVRRPGRRASVDSQQRDVVLAAREVRAERPRARRAHKRWLAGRRRA